VRFLDTYRPQVFAATRIVFGFRFAMHGVRLTFGLFGGPPPATPDAAAPVRRRPASPVLHLKPTYGVAVCAHLVVIALLTTACDSTDPPDSYRRVDEASVRKWVWLGADSASVEMALRNMKMSAASRRDPALFDTVSEYGPGHWVFEFEALGDASMAEAVALEEAGDLDAARSVFLQAAAHYQIAKFPYTRGPDYDHFASAYGKSMTAYERAGLYFPTPLEIVESPFGVGTIRGYLHLPSGTQAAPYPVVIASGGIDVFKTENYPVARELNENGIAVLLLDLPGVGESNFTMADPNHDQVYSDMLSLLEKDPRFDASRVAVFATSWGGNASARAAFNDERFVAAVSACGPIHETFSPPMWAVRFLPAALMRTILTSAIPEVRLDTVVDRVGLPLPLDEDDYVDLAERVSRFSLVHQGLISGSRKAKVPLLVINTTDDPVAPPSDMELLADSAETAEVIYIGEGGHCGDRVRMMAHVIPWLEHHLRPERRSP
jgi:esterase FrsA